VAESDVGRLIGKKGSKIEQLRAESGAQLELLEPAESQKWGGSTDFTKRVLRITAPDRATLERARELVRVSVLVPPVDAMDHSAHPQHASAHHGALATDHPTHPASMVKAEADSKRNQASEDPEAPRRISSADRALEAAKVIEAEQRMAAAEREMAARKLPAAGKPSSSTFHIGKLTSSTFHIGKPWSSSQ